MKIYIEKEDHYLGTKRILAILMITGCIASVLVLTFGAKGRYEQESILELGTIQENSLLAASNPAAPVRPPKTLKMIITAYSSTPWETDDTPFITASGETVKEGIVANNMLPFGTEIRIPELYGDKIFVVEDRMNWTKGYYHIDIWFPDYCQAKSFGAKITYIEVLES